MLTRNNEIDRLIQTGKDYADKLPAGVSPLSRELIHQRAEVGMMMGTPRSQVCEEMATTTVATTTARRDGDDDGDEMGMRWG